MRVIKVLFKKCIRDLVRNLKQFVSIIFILAVAVTLYVGFQANSDEFTRRVNDVYSLGNVSDIWVTFNLDSDSPTGINDDYNRVVQINGGDTSKVERRLYAPVTLSSSSSYMIMSRELPTINVPYNVEKSRSATNNNFFYVDRDFIDRLELTTGQDISLGSTLNLLLDINDVSSGIQDVFYTLIDNYDDILDFIISQQIPAELKDFLQDLIDGADEIKQNLYDAIDNIFEDELSLPLEINGIMSHPENVQTAVFNSSAFLVSTNLIVQGIIDNIEKEVTSSITNDELLTIIGHIFDSISDSLNSGDNQNINRMLDQICNQFVLQVGEGKSISEVTYNLNRYYNSSSNCSPIAITDLESMPSNMIVQNDILSSKQLALCFPLIFFVVAVLVVLTTISALILRERIQIGTLKSLGFKRSTIIIFYISMLEIITFIGVLFGLIIGPILIPRVMNIKYDILYSLTPLQYLFPWGQAILITLGVMIAVALLTYLLLFNLLGEVPADSMRPKVPHIKLKKSLKSFKNTSLTMALRNIRVHITKSLMVVIGVMGCTGLLICGMGVDDVITYGKDNDLNGFLSCDIQLTYGAGVNLATVKDQLLSLKDENGNPYIRTVDEFSLSKVNVKKANTQELEQSTTMYYFSQDNEFFKFSSWELGGIAFDESTASSLNVKVGDSITIHFDGDDYTFPVAEIFYAFTVKGMFVYQETPGMYTRKFSQAMIYLNEGYNREEVAQIILDDPNINALSAVTYDDNIEKIDGYMTSINSMTNTIKIFAVVLAVIVLINLSILNFQERLRDLATLKVLGFSRFEISRSLIYEAMILTVLGSLLGVAIGFPLEILILVTNTTPIVTYHYTLSIWSILISTAVSVLTALGVNALMSLSIKKISMSESLKSIE